MDKLRQSLDELRSAFISSTQRRLELIAELLADPALMAAEPMRLVRLHDQFHNLAGVGGIYGYQRVTTLARSVDLECEMLREEGLFPSASDGVRWRETLQAIRQELAIGQTDPPLLARLARQASRGPEILLVEDDHAQQAALALQMEQLGMTVEAVGSVQEALFTLARKMPDGVIVDLHLPDGTGYELVSCLRQLPDGADIPVLLLSAFANKLDAVETICSGADGHFEKYADWDALIARLSQLMARYQPEKARLLFVEDDAEQAVAIRAILEEAGYQVSHCADGQTFRTELVTFQPDLVLLDINLPDCAGYELARYLRQQEDYAQVPTIFLTAHNEINERRKSLRAGGDEHLVKPVPPALLLATLATQLERARAQQRLGAHDSLTHLLSHSAFWEKAQAHLTNAAREKTSALVWLNLDYFQRVNQQAGPATGDQVLTALATFLRRRLRHSDLLGRFGGDEFALVIEDISAAEAVRLITRLREEFSQLKHPGPDGTTFQLSFSAGIALSQPGLRFPDWKRTACTALAAAKAAGRNCVRSAGSTQSAQV